MSMPLDDFTQTVSELAQQYEARLSQQRDVLRYITEIGASLRLQMDIDTLLKRVTVASCEALRFRYSVLYMSDGVGYFRTRATAGILEEEEAYLHQHPLPDTIVARLTVEEHRLSESYFVPAEAPIWQDENINSFFVVASEGYESPGSASFPAASAVYSPIYWQPEDLMIVPLRSGDGTLLGFLTPDAPLDGLRPTAETMTLLELFVNQAAVVIEGARLQSELREAMQQAQESERLKNHFLMTASHELRTPLTSIQGYLELLSQFENRLDESEKKRFLGNACRACDELVLLLGNVMDASRIDQDRVTLNLKPMRLLEAVRMVMEILEPIVAREQRQVQVDIDAGIWIWVDDLRLRQILLNLIGNALKYTPAPSGLAISAKYVEKDELCQRAAFIHRQTSDPSVDQFVVIAIRDWGPGIAPEDQPKLFTKFMRLNLALNSVERGAGLGLYLCRELTEAMGGHIWMESSGIPGEGSTFFVALPLYIRS